MDIDESNLGEVPAAGRGAGRGRGRGAGGVPVLPEGLWGELSGLGASEKNGSDSIDEDDRFASRGRRQQDEDFGVESMMPSGFGRGRGGGGRGGGRGRGRGPEKVIYKSPYDTIHPCSLRLRGFAIVIAGYERPGLDVPFLQQYELVLEKSLQQVSNCETC